MVLEAAINARATHIVTLNAKDFDAAQDFGLAVVSPQKFLEKPSAKKPAHRASSTIRTYGSRRDREH
jgi:hypothetical protein